MTERHSWVYNHRKGRSECEKCGCWYEGYGLRGFHQPDGRITEKAEPCTRALVD